VTSRFPRPPPLRPLARPARDVLHPRHLRQRRRPHPYHRIRCTTDSPILGPIKKEPGPRNFRRLLAWFLHRLLQPPDVDLINIWAWGRSPGSTARVCSMRTQLPNPRTSDVKKLIPRVGDESDARWQRRTPGIPRLSRRLPNRPEAALRKDGHRDIQIVPNHPTSAPPHVEPARGSLTVAER